MLASYIIKSAYDIKGADIPKVVSPFFAKYYTGMDMLSVHDDSGSWNFDMHMLSDEAILAKIETGELMVLVENPEQPLFYWIEDEERWETTDLLPDMHLSYYIDLILDRLPPALPPLNIPKSQPEIRPYQEIEKELQEKQEAEKRIPSPPQSMNEVEGRMNKATEEVQRCRAEKHPLPQSPYTTKDKMRLVKEGLNERYLVRVIETKYAGEQGSIGYLPEGATTTNYWTTTYTQLEYADKDAELIVQGVGIDFKPDVSYTLLVIDQEKAAEAGDMTSHIPTYGNMKAFAKTDLDDEFAGKEHLVDQALTPEYSRKYETLVNSAWKDGIDLNRQDLLNEHAQALGLNEEEQDVLEIRHSLNQQTGANEHFLGNGMTKDISATTGTTPFGNADPNNRYGPIETHTYDKNPQTLGKLEERGIIKRIELS